MVSVVSPQCSTPWGNGGDMDGAVQEQDEASGPNRAALGMGRGGCGDTVMAERPQSLQGQHKLGPQIGTTSPDASRNTQPEQGPAAPNSPPHGRPRTGCWEGEASSPGGWGQETQFGIWGTW